MNSTLILKNVNKKYEKSNFAIKDISFSVPEGSIVGFIGENGAGKSTTMNCILNVIRRDSGTIEIFGREMTDEDIDIRENIGVVYDSNNFPEHLTAKQLADILGRIYSKWDDFCFEQFLRRFGLPESQKIKTYSRGMSMKLAIAVALSHDSKLLILDEATSGLDPIMRDEILDVLLEFVKQENHSILLSSHITSDLEKIADYIVFIHNGEIILNKTKDELIYEYGVIRCSENDFHNILSEDILSSMKKDYQIDVLIKNRKLIEKKYKNLIVDSVSLDEIMLLLVKGERNARID
ncbi:TPA: ABC transporter ATP-binding protein [Streptococcus equi subsp. zooepidemicus]|uniref:ABC transporter ATP-binding protein n=1 Tax=Streptococcus equi TaxID=1336 RepID=UPI001E3D2F5F|nr:ABC transporter ATP-binding protein [Streptococcus equi]MCD3400642.1 ABC transporter ATP-binding protein [Streptococcus equi subsp. zooepidemicus]UFR17805.1 ABC transporter ATP-binding protein [Streptococcus equi subsp. zooepidemicus]HEL0002259.1 ABC transporter ATP-binding protein [Streptococcus equi subsp. zooepidemicus]HEL0218136.1 ABC transporter ATP-binding protein [Streptococcus equi subsp. zooepidemicus]HEL0228384.1 ABC transporter ATP-binding protein [Streptococcus equi subsp. zooep